MDGQGTAKTLRIKGRRAIAAVFEGAWGTVAKAWGLGQARGGFMP